MYNNHDAIYISSCASWLPKQLTSVTVGLESGEYNEKDFHGWGYQSIAIASPDARIEIMATNAARNAMYKAGIQGAQLAALTFNSVHRHGHPQLWNPASYLQNKLNAEKALPMSIYQGCNGQLLSITFLSQLLKTSEKDYALSVAADQFSRGGINRWHGDYGIVYGDAAAAIVLSKKQGIAKILSLNTVSDASLESLHRFEKPYSPYDLNSLEKHYNVRATKKIFLKKFGKKSIINATKKAMAQLWEQTFSNNYLTPEDIRYFIFPNLAESALDINYFPIYHKAKQKSLWHLGRSLGHLGASDVVVGLDYLFKNNQLQAGDKALCVGAGAGFSWTFMLIEKL